MILHYPAWLILLIPAGVVCMLLRLPTRVLRVLRLFIVLLIVLAMCRPAVELPGRAGTVVMLVDRSESMPGDARVEQEEMVRIVQKSRSSNERLGIVSFGRTAAIEPSVQSDSFAGFMQDVGTDQSSLAAGLETALSLISKDESGRIIVMSDGKWTGLDPSTAAARAAARGVSIDYRFRDRGQANDLAVYDFTGPGSVKRNEAFILTAWVKAPVPQDVQYELKRGGALISSGKTAMITGLNRLLFRDRALYEGAGDYVLTVVGLEGDPVPENNRARVIVGVEGKKSILCVTPTGKSGLAELLRQSGLDVVEKTANECRWSLVDLSSRSAVILENIPANDIGVSGMASLAGWVETVGSGLMLSGGSRTYGSGGYFKSPLERVLPVSMELRKEHRKLSVAIVVALDRSGSMAMPAGGGKTKMDLANIGTVQVLDMLSPMDELGVIAVDSTPHVIVDLSSVEGSASMRGRILQIGSTGGGIFVYEALKASAGMIGGARAQTKHIILFADAADAEQPDQYRELLAKSSAANITVSVVGLGKPSDCDAEFLRDVARRGAGECYFTDNAADIPRLFAQDTLAVARSTFVEEKTQVKFTAGLRSLMKTPPKSEPYLGGYNLCYLRPGASESAVTVDEYKAPVVASWYAGSGRVLCYTGEADGEFSGSVSTWPEAGEFFASLTRWVSGGLGFLSEDMLLTQKIEDGVCRIKLYLDAERSKSGFKKTPYLKVLCGVKGADPVVTEVPLEWEKADLLSADIGLSGDDVIMASAIIEGHDPVSLPPACLPYSPEFRPPQPGRGLETLKMIAGATRGAERTDLAGVWGDLDTRPRYVDVSVWLILMALILILLEVFQRRTGLLGVPGVLKNISIDRIADRARSVVKPGKKRGSKPLPSDDAGLPKEKPVEPAAAGKPAEPRGEESSGTSDAMTQARNRARERNARRG